MPQFTPAMVKLFTDKEKLVNEYPMTYITNPEKEIIYAVVSAANNCEMCLSFHAMGMAQTLSPEDCKLIVDGGLPTQNERARTIAIAAKYAVCHKGILLEREAAHLESMGVSKEMYGEIRDKVTDLIFKAKLQPQVQQRPAAQPAQQPA